MWGERLSYRRKKIRDHAIIKISSCFPSPSLPCFYSSEKKGERENEAMEGRNEKVEVFATLFIRYFTDTRRYTCTINYVLYFYVHTSPSFFNVVEWVGVGLWFSMSTRDKENRREMLNE